MSAPSLLNQPLDILQHIITFLHGSHVATLCRVNKRLNQIYSRDVIWNHLCHRDFHIPLTLLREKEDWKQEYKTLLTYSKYSLSNSLILAKDSSQPKEPDLLKMKDNTNTIQYIGVVEPPPDHIPGLAINPAGVIGKYPCYPLPFARFNLSYFEVEILTGPKNPEAELVVGIGLVTKGYIAGLPGWALGSIGFHSDNGHVYPETSSIGDPVCEDWVVGDVAGCGYDFDRKKVFFVRNGVVLGEWDFGKYHGYLYPYIGLEGQGEMCKINFGSEPFFFDIVKYSLEVAGKDGGMGENAGYVGYIERVKDIKDMPFFNKNHLHLALEDCYDLQVVRGAKSTDTLVSQWDSAIAYRRGFINYLREIEDPVKVKADLEVQGQMVRAHGNPDFQFSSEDPHQMIRELFALYYDEVIILILHALDGYAKKIIADTKHQFTDEEIMMIVHINTVKIILGLEQIPPHHSLFRACETHLRENDLLWQEIESETTQDNAQPNLQQTGIIYAMRCYDHLLNKGHRDTNNPLPRIETALPFKLVRTALPISKLQHDVAKLEQGAGEEVEIKVILFAYIYGKDMIGLNGQQELEEMKTKIIAYYRKEIERWKEWETVFDIEKLLTQLIQARYLLETEKDSEVTVQVMKNYANWLEGEQIPENTSLRTFLIEKMKIWEKNLRERWRYAIKNRGGGITGKIKRALTQTNAIPIFGMSLLFFGILAWSLKK